MPVGKSRLRLAVRGLGKLEVKESVDADFSEVGYLDSSAVNIDSKMEEIMDEAGGVSQFLSRGKIVSLQSQLLQVGKDEMDLLRLAEGKEYAIRYSGMNNAQQFQYWCLEKAIIDSSLSKEYQTSKQLLQLRALARKQADLSYDVPEVYLKEAAAEIRTKDLKLWTDPILDLNTETTKLLDISGFARHGTLSSAFGTIWQQTTTPKEFLRFDGAVDQVSFGDILNDDGSADFMIECWVRVQAADATKQEILSKKALIDDISAGFSVYRTTGNLLSFRIGSGAASVVVSNAATTLQNVWKLFAVAIDRNGNATPYLNGVADGTPASVAAIATGTNALNLYLGRDGTNFGQVDVGAVRHYIFGAGNLPSDIATIALNHYNAEKAFYGL